LEETRKTRQTSVRTADYPCDVSPNALQLQPETLAKSFEQDNATSDAKKDNKYLD
jgi:hypothetical protein